MSNSNFDFNELVRESKEVLINPKSYFSTMKTSGGFVEPLIKAVIYGAVAGIIVFLWGIFGIGSVAGGVMGGAIGAMALIWYIIAAIFGLFIGAVILLVISSICRGSTDFETCTRVTAAIMVLMPVSALLSFTMGINTYFGIIINLAVNIFALWLIFNGLVESLKAKQETARIVMYILIALLVLFTLIGLGTRNRVNRYLDGYNKEFKELMREAEKD